MIFEHINFSADNLFVFFRLHTTRLGCRRSFCSTHAHTDHNLIFYESFFVLNIKNEN